MKVSLWSLKGPIYKTQKQVWIRGKKTILTVKTNARTLDLSIACSNRDKRLRRMRWSGIFNPVWKGSTAGTQQLCPECRIGQAQDSRFVQRVTAVRQKPTVRNNKHCNRSHGNGHNSNTASNKSPVTVSSPQNNGRRCPNNWIKRKQGGLNLLF